MENVKWVIGMYVYQDSTATIETLSEIEFRAFPDDEISGIASPTRGTAKVDLRKGIYRFAKAREAPLAIAASGAELVTATDKDPPSDPTATSKFKNAFGDVTYESLKRFFPSIDRGVKPEPGSS